MPRKSNSTSHLSARPSKGKDVGRNLTSEAIAADLTAFRKQGGRIEVLGNTPLSATNVTAFRSKSDAQRRQPRQRPPRPPSRPARPPRSADRPGGLAEPDRRNCGVLFLG